MIISGASVLSIDGATITSASRFGEDLETDSVDLIEIVSEIEHRAGVAVEDQQLYELETVGELVALIGRLRGD